MGLALCLTVAAQEKAKTTNVQGYALAIDNAFYSFKESTKAITDQNSRRGFDMQFFFTQKADYPIMGIANIAGAGMLFTVRNTKIAKEYSANSTVVLECIGLTTRARLILYLTSETVPKISVIHGASR